MLVGALELCARLGSSSFQEVQAALRREADPAQEVIEARVGAQRIPDGVHFQKKERSRAPRFKG